MQKNFAIAGCGRISHRHATEISKIGNVKAVCDSIPERAYILAGQFNATPYDSLERLLATEKNIDIISICTPNGLHATHTIQALQAGYNVLCEKPMCLHTADGKQMIAAADEASKKLFVVKSTRHNPLVQQVKALLTNDQLGQVYSFQLNCVWNRPPAYYANSWKGTLLLDGGTLFTQFSHYIDVLMWLLGTEKTICGFRKNAAHGTSIEFEDSGALAVEMQSGAIGTIHYSVNAFEKNQEVSLTLVTTKGTIQLGGTCMNELIYQHPILVNQSTVGNNNPANDYGFYKGSMSNHDMVYQHLLLAMNGEQSSTTDGMEALKTVQFIEKIYQAIHL